MNKQTIFPPFDSDNFVFHENETKSSSKLQSLSRSVSLESLSLFEKKMFPANSLPSKINIKIGDILRIGYLIPEGQKERTQYYEGIVIAQKNQGFRKSITLRRTVQGIGVEQVFFLYSPKIISLTIKQSSKVRRAKLFFLRALSGKQSRLKTEF